MMRLTFAGKFWLTYLSLLALGIYFLLNAVGAFGSPFLICDPQDNVEWYEIAGLGVDGTHLDVEPSGTQGYVKHDLAGSVVGTPYDITLRACNLWGCSSSVPFSFTPTDAPTDLHGLAIIP